MAIISTIQDVQVIATLSGDSVSTSVEDVVVNVVQNGGDTLVTTMLGAPGVAGPRGLQGPQGPAGDLNSELDLPDFTLLFDNLLI